MMNEKDDVIKSEIAAKVKKIVVEHLGVDEASVSETSNFTEDLGADSLDLVEMVMAFEEEFNIEIPEDESQKITTVGAAIEKISEKKQKQA